LIKYVVEHWLCVLNYNMSRV